ncbi:MAG: outer membrane biogenesis lipoprotein LolB [Marivirga sp.]|jgi:outer membrane biogenesis lipoprotein LolB
MKLTKTVSLVAYIVGAALLNACAQTTEVPKAVMEAFSQKSPDAKKVKWDKEDETEWEAKFKTNGREYSANFTTAGGWKETEHEINMNKAPAAVKATLEQEFRDYAVEESEISKTTEGKVYEFALEKDETEIEVAIDVNGKIIKKQLKEKHESNY